MPSHAPFRHVAALFIAGTIATITPAQAIEVPANRPNIAGDLTNYAETLVAITRVQRALAGQLAGSPKADASALKLRADTQIAQILKRHDLDTASFNAISARVENQPSVRARVNQLTMEEMLGN